MDYLTELALKHLDTVTICGEVADSTAQAIKHLVNKFIECNTQLESLKKALEYYAGIPGESEWDGCKFLTFDKFGGLDDTSSGPFVANQILTEIQGNKP